MTNSDSNGLHTNNNNANHDRANSNGDPIQPADIPLTKTPTTPVESIIPWQQQRTTYVALAICILLALVVIFVLPSLIKPPETIPVVIGSETTPAQAVKESPFRDAQLAKARRESQDSLGQLLEKQKFLEKRNVQLWGESAFETALKHASEGDLLYRQRDFPGALAAYQTALNQLSDLEQRIPEELSNNLKKGDEAFTQGQAKDAKQYYELALAIDASNAEAKAGLERTASLSNVLTLIAQGNDSLEERKLEEAKDYFQQALALDSLHTDAINGNKKVANLILDRDFNSAMSRGYQALETSKFSSAAKAFRDALELRPGDNTANTGLAQANNSSAQYTARTRLNQAASLESKEKWHEARDVYNKMLAQDSSVVTAKLGQIRSSARAGLSDSIEKILAAPLRLSSTNVFKHSQQVLKDAEGIKSPGPRHKKQLSQLKQTLQLASAPVAVELQSDNTTQVTVFRVGDLGAFSQKQLSLKPGNYVAVGNRSGYRDVRVEFQVTHKGLSSPVTVICREPV